MVLGGSRKPEVSDDEMCLVGVVLLSRVLYAPFC
jgi:hypothetical protein